MIRLLLRLYPRAWRDRYGAELAELVDETGLDIHSAVDIARAAAREQRVAIENGIAGGMTMTLGPAWRHPTAWAVFGAAVLTPTALFTLGSLLAYQFRVAAATGAMDAFSAWIESQPRVVDLLLVVAPLVAALAALLPLVRIELRQTDGEREGALRLRLRVGNLIVAAAGIAIGALLVWHIVVESVLQVGA